MNVNQTIKAGIGLSSGSGIGPLSADMTSKTDFLARLLGYHYLNRQDLVHIKDEPIDFHGDLSPDDEAKLLNALTNLQEQVQTQAPAIVTKMVKTGDVCPTCHTFTMIRTGTCTTCMTCGNTSGCS